MFQQLRPSKEWPQQEAVCIISGLPRDICPLLWCYAECSGNSLPTPSIPRYTNRAPHCDRLSFQIYWPLKIWLKGYPETSIRNCHYAPRNIPEERRSDKAVYLSGKGHLACVSFAGGRAFPRRKNLFSDDDRVRNDVQFLSHYKKNKDAAGNPRQASTGGKENARLLTTRDNQASLLRASVVGCERPDQSAVRCESRRISTLVCIINMQ